MDQWDWRSNMNALPPGYPELRNAQVRNPTDNVRPMAYDALSAMGVGHEDAQNYAGKMGDIAPWTPPGFMVDAAGGIGGKLHEGKPAEAAANAWLTYLLGKAGQGAARMVTPTARDAGIAKVLEALHPNSKSVSPMTSRHLSHGAINDAGDINSLLTKMGLAPANANARLGVVK
jgi:hypothetical protein